MAKGWFDWLKQGARIDAAHGFMARLRDDTRGNALAIMAGAMVPLAGMVGGGIDLSRMYIVKTRLQHACDAGALAGRKAMGSGIWSQSGGAPGKRAIEFFDANIQDDAYGSTGMTKAFVEDAGTVRGTASATVPMTLMRVLGKTSELISVTCEAEMRLPNTDVMFVLDNTGSMGDPAPGGGGSKMAALKVAVKCFYEIVARLDTDATCDAGAPSGGTGDQVQVRFGFVPYDQNVNVGRLLKTEWVANSWPYQSREAATVYGLYSSWDGNNTRNVEAYGADQMVGAAQSAANSNACNSLVSVPADTYTANGPASWPESGTETATAWKAYAPYIHRKYKRVYDSAAKLCSLQYNERNLERRANYSRSTAGVANVVEFPAWTYKQVSLNVSGLKSGTNWNAGFTLPIGDNYAARTINWDGCIEERHTVKQATYDPIPADANDLDIDTVPSAGDADSLWGPALRRGQDGGVLYGRRDGYNNSGALTTNERTTFYQSYSDTHNYTCVIPAKKMQAWPDATDFDDYVDLMTPGGNTYHDIGMLWGARLLSPTGLFQSENEFTPAGGEIDRNLILMTDGETCTNVKNASAYGWAWYDRRQTDAATAPTDGCVDTGTLTKQVNTRTQAICKAVRNKNITLWVIYFGTSDAITKANMTSCASSGRFFEAKNSAELQQTFASIANQISQLRLTQ